MRFHIKHVTRYAYSAPVFCEPITIRLRPRCDAAQQLLWSSLSLDPVPAGTSDMLEVDGHVATRAWFGGVTSYLTITHNCVVDTLLDNPYNYLLDQAALRLGFNYPEPLVPALTPYLSPVDHDPLLLDLARRLALEANHDTQGFLAHACKWLYQNIDYHVRHEGPPRQASQTLHAGSGACRDSAVLLMELCRHQGLATRFVSGYQYGDPDQEQQYLHAWVEAFLPGAGWRGYDPTTGLAVADQHVAAAAAAHPAATMPLEGSFRGNHAQASMQVQVVVRAEDEPTTTDSAVAELALRGS